MSWYVDRCRRKDIVPAACHYTKSLFIHIPKAAGTSICLSLYGHQLGHTFLSEYLRYCPKVVCGYFKFTVCRDPLTRAYSTFRFYRRGGMTQADRRWIAAHLPPSMNFGEFVSEIIVRRRAPWPIHLLEQHRFIEKFPNGPVGVDLVVKMEELEAAIPRLTVALGRPLVLGRLNSSEISSDTVHEFGDRTVQQAIFEAYHRDYWLFGYPPPPLA